MFLKRLLNSFADCFAPFVHQWFLRDLVLKTKNFGNVTWLGKPVWQNVFDLWTIQETIVEIKPELLIECGTNRGGSSYFYGDLLNLIGRGSIITIDVEKLHELSHPRVTYLLGSSTAPEILETVRQRVADTSGPIMVILDSDHSKQHVAKELACYANFVTPGSYCMVQDGVIDTLWMFRAGRPGPLPAIEEFLQTTNNFEVDSERSSRFLVTHHPKGWLRRKPST